MHDYCDCRSISYFVVLMTDSAGNLKYQESSDNCSAHRSTDFVFDYLLCKMSIIPKIQALGCDSVLCGI